MLEKIDFSWNGIPMHLPPGKIHVPTYFFEKFSS